MTYIILQGLLKIDDRIFLLASEIDGVATGFDRLKPFIYFSCATYTEI